MLFFWTLLNQRIHFITLTQKNDLFKYIQIDNILNCYNIIFFQKHSNILLTLNFWIKVNVYNFILE